MTEKKNGSAKANIKKALIFIGFTVKISNRCEFNLGTGGITDVLC